VASPIISSNQRLRILIMRGTGYQSASLLDLAIADYRQAVQLSPSKEALLGLAHSYQHKADHDKAVATMNDYVSYYRDDPEGYHARQHSRRTARFR
jgi:lipopolysaccharide biosynthesis regulator YciM